MIPSLGVGGGWSEGEDVSSRISPLDLIADHNTVPLFLCLAVSEKVALICFSEFVIFKMPSSCKYYSCSGVS